MQWTIVIEYDPESRHYVGTVPGLDIVVDAKSERSALKLAREAIPLHLEALRRRGGIPAVPAKVLQVEVCVGRLPGEISRAKFLRAMNRLGWTLDRAKGSHHQFVHPVFPGVLTVALHGTISRIAVRKTLRMGGIDEEDFLRAL